MSETGTRGTSRLRACGPRTKVSSVFVAFVGVWGKRAAETQSRQRNLWRTEAGGRHTRRFWGPGCADAARTAARGRAAKLCAVAPLSRPLCSSQGDRGFDGLAGLPGEKGHRVSVPHVRVTGTEVPMASVQRVEVFLGRPFRKAWDLSCGAGTPPFRSGHKRNSQKPVPTRCPCGKSVQREWVSHGPLTVSEPVRPPVPEARGRGGEGPSLEKSALTGARRGSRKPGWPPFRCRGPSAPLRQRFRELVAAPGVGPGCVPWPGAPCFPPARAASMGRLFAAPRTFSASPVLFEAKRVSFGLRHSEGTRRHVCVHTHQHTRLGTVSGGFIQRAPRPVEE